MGSGAGAGPCEGVEDLGAVAVDGVMECGVCWDSWDLMWSAELHSKRMKDWLSQGKQEAPPSLPASIYSIITTQIHLENFKSKFLAKRKYIFYSYISNILFPK